MESVNSYNKGFRSLIVWRRMQELVVLVYQLTKILPTDEKFGLISQMRRAVVSVLLYLERAETSLLELEAQGEVCLVLNYFLEKEYQKFDSKRAEVGYLLHRYKSKVV